MGQFVTVFILISMTLAVTSITEAKRQKHKKNSGKALDPSRIFHALSAVDDTDASQAYDKVFEYTKDATPQTESHDTKHVKKNKKKHKKRHNKGSARHKQNTSCCQNGGLCVMGAFCHCRSGFEGRYCEIKVTTRNCGPIRHEEVFRDGCTLCQCMDGMLHCLPGVYSECDDGQVEPIFYNFNEEVKPTSQPFNVENEGTSNSKQDPILKKLKELEEAERQNSSGAVQPTVNSNILLLTMFLWTIIFAVL